MENRGIAVALWGIGISIGYACCPSMPQYRQCMALYVVVCNSSHAANGRQLEGIVGMHGAIVGRHYGAH